MGEDLFKLVAKQLLKIGDIRNKVVHEGEKATPEKQIRKYYTDAQKLVLGEKDGPNNQSINYTGLIPILIKEMKELKERVKALESNQPLLKVDKKID